MPISYSELRIARLSPSVTVAKSMQDASRLGLKTAFLCHSHSDQTLVKGLVNLLTSSGWNVYIDWLDGTMPSVPNSTTAAKIKTRIVTCNYFLFLATNNSMSSRWCPWEIGFADGKKAHDNILIVPTKDDAGAYHGNEYLGLYRRIDLNPIGSLSAIRPSEQYGVAVQGL